MKKIISLIAFILVGSIAYAGYAGELEITGLIEVEAGDARVNSAFGMLHKQNTLTIATGQLNITKQLTKEINSRVTFLYEQGGEESIGIDEAMVSYKESNWLLIGGRYYLPFGLYDTQMVSDPLTLEVGETRAEALLVGYTINRREQSRLFSTIVVKGYLFNGSAKNIRTEDFIDDWGVSLRSSVTSELTVGVGALSNLASTNAGLTDGVYQSKILGLNAFVQLALDKITLTGEVVGSGARIQQEVLDGNNDGQGDRPFVWVGELSYALNEKQHIAISLASARQLALLPILQTGIAYLHVVMDVVTVGAEYQFSQFESDLAEQIGGISIEHVHQVTIKIGLDF